MLSPRRFKYKSTPWRERNFNQQKGYLGFCFSFCLKQLISTSTRVTSKTVTLIDHPLTNSSHKVSQSGVIESGISDHTILYTVQEKHLRLSSIKTMTHLLG